eukprot:512484_1
MQPPTKKQRVNKDEQDIDNKMVNGPISNDDKADNTNKQEDESKKEIILIDNEKNTKQEGYETCTECKKIFQHAKFPNEEEEENFDHDVFSAHHARNIYVIEGKRCDGCDKVYCKKCQYKTIEVDGNYDGYDWILCLECAIEDDKVQMCRKCGNYVRNSNICSDEDICFDDDVDDGDGKICKDCVYSDCYF